MVLALSQMLINQASVTPNDGHCQKIISERLKKSGFSVTDLPFGQVSNMFARKGTQSPLFVFLGHTDVVPSGPVEKWTFPPFESTEKAGYLYGRGAQDMKSSIAAMVIACEKFITEFPDHAGSIGFILTSDEEGPAVNGTTKVIDYLQANQIFIDYCLVGEPSSQKIAGDMVKIGRRGSLSAELTIFGQQGHIAYPQLASNPIHLALPALTELLQTAWSLTAEKNAYFEDTCLQISSIHAGAGASNVIPGELVLQCNFRYSDQTNAVFLQEKFEHILQKYHFQYAIRWQHSASPFLTTQGKLLIACQHSIQKIQHIYPVLSTSGGTSDGRFVAPTGSEVIELGVCNDTIHQINERVKISDIESLSLIYQEMLKQLLS